MKGTWLCFLLFIDVFIVNASSVRLVRLIDHTSYAVSVVQQTMSRVEQRQWCNLKMDDMNIIISENVLGSPMAAEIDLKDGFVLSLQKIDILQTSIQQVWLPVSGNTTRVEVRANVRMHNVAIGFDVITKMEEQVSRSTGLFVYPEIQIRFTITKHLFTDAITVDVIGLITRTTNRMQFIPENEITKVLTILFDWNSTAPSIERWAADIFTPITLQLATKEVDFPRICYDCPA